MGRVGRYHGIHLKDAIKFAWMDAIFAVERMIDRLYRNRVQRVALETNVTAEANAFESYEAATNIITENAAQEAHTTTDNPQKKSWEYL